MEIPNVIYDHSWQVILINIIVSLHLIGSIYTLVYVWSKSPQHLNLAIWVSCYIMYILCIQIVPLHTYSYLLQAYEWMFMSIIVTMIVDIIAMLKESHHVLITFTRIALGILSICSFLLPPLVSPDDIYTAISLLFIPYLLYLAVVVRIIRGSEPIDERFDLYIDMFCKCLVIVLFRFAYLRIINLNESLNNDYLTYRILFTTIPLNSYWRYMYRLS